MTGKPIQIVREEFVTCLSTIISETKLPAFIKVDVLRAFTNDLKAVAAQEYEMAVNAWKESEEGGDSNG